MRQPPLSERGATKWRGMFRNNQKSPYRKIANCAKVIIVSRPAPLLMTFGKGYHGVAGYVSKQSTKSLWKNSE